MKAAFVTVVLAFFSSVAQGVGSSPFGLSMGWSLEQLREIDPALVLDTRTQTYLTYKPPQPNTAFSAYVLYVAPKTGLCLVSAVGVDFKQDETAQMARAEYLRFLSLLSDLYGKAERVYTMKPTSVFTAPEQAAMSLHLGDRVARATWTVKGGATLPDDLAAVVLEVKAASASTTYLRLRYHFQNTSECATYYRNSDTKGL